MGLERTIVLKGAKDAFGAPAAVLFAGMLGFGAMGKTNGLDIWVTSATSFFMFALPGQVVLIEMLVLQASALTIAIAVTLTAARFLTMCLTLFPQFPEKQRSPWYYALVHLVAMTAWAISMRDFPKMKPDERLAYFTGFAFVCWAVSTPATALGFMLAGEVPRYINLGLVFINPLFFLLTFTEVKVRANQIAIVLGAIAGPLIYLYSPDYSLLYTGLIGGTVAYGVDRYLRQRKTQESSS
ncbi:AzlC family ABC transporter permease [Polynucleobacter sp. MWH-Loch1C5]|uniref:AzlC family ABC transporter permease n=1 Tax=Polynucleobacter sp. MWH-Loch1C5 TaxID=2689108 RepID=UPI001C0D0D39|nr:AzlC family ABC transporter permease [Polynucleobacter sp. MWH-Loch1C5]MBU3542141.1 AzlC family ABC transporter permease [Polynucleobacter sp. MWH-Loch1C5]